MKIRSIALCLVLMLIGTTLTVMADDTSVFERVDVDYNRETGIVSIEGSLISQAKESTARMMVLKPNTDIEKLIDGSLTFKDCGIHASETSVSDNTFAFDNFIISGSYEPGDYIIRIAAGGEVYTRTLAVASPAQAIGLLDNVTDSTVMEAYINKYNDVYGLDIGNDSLYADFESDDRAYVLTQLCGRTYEDLADFRNEFKLHTILRKVYLGPWGTLDDVLSSNAAFLTLSTADYKALSSSKQDDVCKALCGNVYTGVQGLKSAFDTAVTNANKVISSQNVSHGSSGGSGGKTYYTEAEDTIGEAPQIQELPAESSGVVFSDLDGYEWAKSSISLLYEKDVISGRGNGIFDPGAAVSRSEAVKMVVLAMGKLDSSADCDFADVNADSWAYPYVASATAHNIVYGYGDGRFGANDNITREDLAVIVMRAALNYGIEIEEKTGEIIFKDSRDISSYAAEAVRILQKANVINGSDGYFSPKATATRAETAKIIAYVISEI